MLKIRIIIGLSSFLLLVIIFELIRRRKFMEKYALLWIFSALTILSFSIFPNVLFKISGLLGMHYITTLLFFSFLFFLSILLYLSIALSELSEKNKILGQEIGILKLRLKELKKYYDK